MSRLSGWWTRIGADDRGGVSPMILMLLPALVGLAGIAYDGGMAFQARRESINEAAAAARAGAADITEDSLYAGYPQLAPSAAATARAFALNNGALRVQASQMDGHLVEVTIEDEIEPVFLGMFGIGPLTVEGTATARVRQAVTASGS